jgi:hypothetical protein
MNIEQDNDKKLLEFMRSHRCSIKDNGFSDKVRLNLPTREINPFLLWSALAFIYIVNITAFWLADGFYIAFRAFIWITTRVHSSLTLSLSPLSIIVILSLIIWLISRNINFSTKNNETISGSTR